MSINLPTDNFNPMEPVPNEKAAPSDEELKLAKVGSSKEWKLVKDYMEGRINAYKVGLFGEDLAGKSTDIIGQRFLAATSVIGEFEKLVNEIETVTKAVKDAQKG